MFMHECPQKTPPQKTPQTKQTNKQNNTFTAVTQQLQLQPNNVESIKYRTTQKVGPGAASDIAVNGKKENNCH